MKRIITFSFTLFLLLSFITLDLWAAPSATITITPDKELYSPGESALFNIEMKYRNKLLRLKKEQIIATFPNPDTPVTLTQAGRGKYTYTTGALNSGTHTLEAILYKHGALVSISRLERTKTKIERNITHLEGVKESLKNPKAAMRIEKTIEGLKKNIDKIERTIQRHRTDGVIGQASSTITVQSGSIIVKEISAIDPIDLAVDSDENLYILESSGSCVTLYDQEGNYLRGITISASNPKGMAIDSSSNIYIADTGNDRILKLDNAGNPDTTFADNGILTHNFSGPYGIGIDSRGDIYVSDTGNNRIVKFDSVGKFLKEWGTSGTDPGQMNQPKGIFVDNCDHIYVADTGNNRIQEFSSSGSLYSFWGEAGNGDGQFILPADITASPYYFYVADTGNNRIEKFSEEKEFISKIDELSLNTPSAVAVDSDLVKELIYIADTGNNRVLKVELPITLPDATWSDMKEKLSEGDIEGALTYFSEASQDRYREIFTLLQAELPQIANQMQDIHLISIRGDVAEYIIVREEDGTEMGYFIYFIKDEDGNWKIDIW
jgi:sugar lactone lactonase YvrE